jgi:hypothetical protein
VREATVELNLTDCIGGMNGRLDENSIDLSIYSPPFEELFTYSGSVHDLGNNGSTINMREGRFALNYRFFVEQLFRVTKPGTNTCCHIQQLRAWACQHGFIGIRDFRGAMIDVYSAAGFVPKGEFVIAKNPQRMAQALDLHSLLFVTGKRNSNNLAPCPNDYVLIFQKPGECADPVKALFDKEINPDGWITTNEWIRDAHGIWTDIQETDVLDGWKAARECEEEKHVCALQLQVIYRLLRLYSNPICFQPNVMVLDPFGGVGSTAAMCLGMECNDGYLPSGHHRNVTTFELKASYHDQSLRNIEKTRKMVLARERDREPLFAGQE